MMNDESWLVMDDGDWGKLVAVWSALPDQARSVLISSMPTLAYRLDRMRTYSRH